MEQIAGDAFRFGQQTEEHEHYLLSQVQGNDQRLQTTEDTMTTLRATLGSVQHNLREGQSDSGKLEMQLALLERRLVADQSASPQQITNSANSQFDEFRQSLQQKLDQYKEELSKEFEEFKQDHQAQWQQIHKDNIMSEVQNLLETRIRSHGVAHNAQLSQTRLDLEVALSTKLEQRFLSCGQRVKRV